MATSKTTTSVALASFRPTESPPSGRRDAEDIACSNGKMPADLKGKGQPPRRGDDYPGSLTLYFGLRGVMELLAEASSMPERLTGTAVFRRRWSRRRTRDPRTCCWRRR